MKKTKLAFVFIIGMILIAMFSTHLANTPEHNKAETDGSKINKIEHKVPGSKSCGTCHQSITRGYTESSHSKAGVDCTSCHTFRDDLLDNPDDYFKEGFYQDVTISVCQRCHSAQAEDLERGKHINPLTKFYLNLFEDRGNDELPSSFSTKQKNPCLCCHQPHPVER